MTAPLRLALVACESLEPELAAWAAGLDPARCEVELVSFAPHCGRPPLAWDDLAQLLPEPQRFGRVIVLGSCCLQQLELPPDAPGNLVLERMSSCFSLLCSDYCIVTYQQQGAYLVSSGWLARWEERLQQQGLDAALAPEIFAASVRGIVHLDTGVLADARQRLARCAEFLDQSFQSVPVGLELLGLRLGRLIDSWQAELQQDARRQLAAARQKGSDYAMALDLLKLIMQTTGSEAVAQEILQLYFTMFAAGELAYVPISGGAAGPVTRLGSGSPVGDQELQRRALSLANEYRLLPSGAGFLLRIVYEGSVLGVVSIDRIALPENLEQYLHLALETVVVCAVVLNNALNLERILSMTDQLRRSKQALRESEKLYHAIFEESAAVQLLVDPDTGRIVDANRAAIKFYGYRPELLRGMSVMELSLLPESEVRQAMEGVLHGNLRQFHFRHRLADGTLREVEVFSSPIWKDGRLHLNSIIHDITDRIRVEEAKLDLERRLQQAQKAQSLGRMAGAIAHKFNNLLGAVIGNLELAGLKLDPESPVEDNLAEALKAAGRAAEVSTLMLAYLGQVHGSHLTVDLADLCRRSLGQLRAAMPAEVQLAEQLPVHGPLVSVNEQQMVQVLSSLVTNAWEACEGRAGGVRISVSSCSAEAIPAKNRFPLDWEPGQAAYCCIEVADRGCGIAQEDFDELFDPFFSSKFTGRGLGLPMVLGMVRAHGGAVSVESRLGLGSRFRIFLPEQGQAAASPPAERGSRQQPRGGTVLLIEDEAGVRKIASALLTCCGFDVVEAKDGVEGVELFTRHRKEIRLVLSDLTMPRQDGWTTLAALRRLAPGIPVILASGYDQSQAMAERHGELPQAFLRKPFGLAGLQEALRLALDTPDSA
jgi:PAS domain S-box-containing protein